MDVKKIICYALIGISFLLILDILFNKKNDKIIGRIQNNESISMPLVHDSNIHTSAIKSALPIAERGTEFRDFLAASVKINVSGGSGSGTIVYYDAVKNEAYITSCGHLWDGTQTVKDLQNKSVKAEIVTWYHNSEKLPSPKKYPADVLFWSNVRGYDSSLLKFKPDWIPNYFPIAPIDYNIPVGKNYHSCGCDAGKEVAHYDVEIVGYRGDDLVTTKNSPRPGRSGGGLLSEDGFYIATCWGTSNVDGSGIGYFTPLKSIHQVYKSNGYNWLLEVNNALARKIPIVDINNPQNNYPKNYIGLPSGNSIPIPH